MLPRATFVEDVGAFLAEKGGSSDSVLKEMNATYRRYKMVEQQLLQRRMRLETKLPDIKKALDMVTLLLEKKEAAEGVLVDFELHDQVSQYPGTSVYIFLTKHQHTNRSITAKMRAKPALSLMLLPIKATNLCLCSRITHARPSIATVCLQSSA
jgi:hypothetical protein